jgi:hypothetical protein
MKKCPDGHSVPNNAKFCPYDGYQFPGQSCATITTIFAIVGIVIVCIVIGGLILLLVTNEHSNFGNTRPTQPVSFIPTNTALPTPILLFPTLTPPPTLPATPQPSMFYFQSCLESCNGTNSQSSFPEKTTIIYLQWQYENIPANSSYVRFTAQNGKDWARYECTWPNPSSGTEHITFTEPAGIRSGDWLFTVEINGVVLLQETINVQGNWDYWDPAGYFNTCYGKR